MVCIVFTPSLPLPPSAQLDNGMYSVHPLPPSLPPSVQLDNGMHSVYPLPQYSLTMVCIVFTPSLPLPPSVQLDNGMYSVHPLPPSLSTA